MADKREQILSQLFATIVGLTVTDSARFKNAYRNRGLVDQDERPASVLLDGAETSRLTGSRQGRGGASGIGPQLVTMRPEVYFLVKDRRPLNEEIGTELNTMRLEYLAAVEMDAALRTLVGPNGAIELTGTDVDMKGGSSGEGQMRLDFSITYVFDPTRQ